jgi:hypothetical protein
MLQCLMATIPFTHFYRNADSAVTPPFGEPKERFKEYAADKKGLRMHQFVKEYFNKATTALDPSSVFDIICSQKKYFGNFSEQDAHDALLTMLDVLIEGQKLIRKARLGIDDKRAFMDNRSVPVGSIFSFDLCNKRTPSHLPS